MVDADKDNRYFVVRGRDLWSGNGHRGAAGEPNPAARDRQQPDGAANERDGGSAGRRCAKLKRIPV